MALLDHEDDSGGLIDYLTGIFGGKAIAHATTPQQPQQTQGYPGAQAQTSEMNLSPGQSEMPAWGNAPGVNTPPPQMQQPQQAQRPQQQGGGLVNTMTQLLASPLLQGAAGAAGGALSQPRHAGTQQKIGGALLGGMGGFNVGQQQQANQQYAAQQQQHQQFLEQLQQQQMQIQQWRQIQEEALLARQTKALEAIPEAQRPYYQLGTTPPQPPAQSEAKLAFEAEAGGPEGERSGRALKRLQDVKAAEKNAPTAATEETARHNRAIEGIQTQAERGRDARAAVRKKIETDKDAKEAKRDKVTAQSQLNAARKEYLNELPPTERVQSFDSAKFHSWLQGDNPSLYEDVVKHKLINPGQKAGQAGGGNLEQKYPALVDKIKQARAAGHSEADIEKYLQGKK